jgi:tRNA threonylcarbamoyladenosine biosynthesis protein TsaE
MTVTASEDELYKVVDYLEKELPFHAVVSLRGDLASGKTTLVRAIAEKLAKDNMVTSPTFSLQHNYGNLLYHYDLYRVDFGELGRLGLLEEFEKPGWHIVEWMDESLKSFLGAAGYNLWEVSITPVHDRRIYRIEPVNA